MIAMREGQLSRAEYLERVRAKALPQVDLEDRLEELQRVLGSIEREQNLIEMAEAFLVDPCEGYEGVLVILPIGRAKATLSDPTFKISNWHYDRRAECLLINMVRGRHESLSAVLHQLYVNTDRDTELAAEKFIDEAIGFFKSSSSMGRMLIGRRTKLNAQERAVFGSIASF